LYRVESVTAPAMSVNWRGTPAPSFNT
jgi:hypothetical protein